MLYCSLFKRPKSLGFKFVPIIAFSLLLTACTNFGSTSNKVTQIKDEQSVVIYMDHPDYGDRFTNVYRKFKDYPVTCEENCYEKVKSIQCESDMERCRFIGANPRIHSQHGIEIQWLGHAFFNITMPNGQTFIFDPVFEQFDWPVDLAFKLSDGFYRNPSIKLPLTTIQNADAILYSHIHYDHFNKTDIATIGNQPQYFTPLGFADHFEDGGYKVSEFAWYSSMIAKDTKIHFVPANHFSSRIWVPFIYEDNNKSLWGGWVLEQNGLTIFYAGDTGYSPHFKDIHDKYGDIDVCLLPIASYYSQEDPDWYRKVHTTPEDALVAGQDLNCGVIIPWGYGNSTWKMGDKTSHSALFRLLNMNKQLNSAIPLYILNEGDSVRL